jgi:ferrous iron transport protein B
MKILTIGLVGNPNCGKSTLFNALTGASQKVGNWPGVTVECRTGKCNFQRHHMQVVDLPGIYQLSNSAGQQAIDEQIATDYILNKHADIIVNIIDAAHLERHLYLTLQLLAMNIPLVIVVNMMDIAQRRQLQVDLKQLQNRLGCPVVGLIASKGTGVTELKKTISALNIENFSGHCPITYPQSLQQAMDTIAQAIHAERPALHFCAEWLSAQLLQDSDYAEKILPPSLKLQALACKATLEQELDEELDIVFADIFYTSAHQIANEIITQHSTKTTLTERIDKIILNRFLGIPIFLAVMYMMFLFAINLGGAFQDFFDISSEAIFVNGTTQLLSHIHAPNWLTALLAAGFGRGINTTITFIPVIGGMFFFLAFLESSGYMARATFVIDRFMRTVGLPGKSFVPMIVGFGCNVPAILAARTLENPKDRILTILMSPFMSCGARLAIYAVFTAAFFPAGGQNVVFILYFIGIVAAILTGLILRKTVLKGDLTPLVLELPAYHLPTLRTLFMQTWQRLKSFIFRAGKLIVPICMLIGVLNAINTDGTLNQRQSSANSLLSAVGRVVTPVFAPMGIQENNWPATVGLVIGVLAKEVVVATLNTLYTQEVAINQNEPSTVSVWAGVKEAIASIPENLVALKNSFVNPVIASAPEHALSHRVYGEMYKRFAGQTAAFAYLLFVLLYFPCISATAVMAKELNKKWTAFSVIWSTGLAYAVATSFYQLATFNRHPTQSLIWLTALSIIFATVLSIMKKYGQHSSLTRVCQQPLKIIR